MGPRRQRTLTWLAGLLLAAGMACAGSVDARPVPTAPPAEPTPAPRPISLPSDEGPHADNLEWWYYNGHLVSDDGTEFGFHFVVFQSLAGEEGVYAAQLGITRVGEARYVHDFRYDSVPTQPGEALLELNVGGWRLGVTEGRHSFVAQSDDGHGLVLSLEPGTPALLHDEIGWLGGPFGWTYYYSWPRMRVSGDLTLDGETMRVSGEAWFDHQWGDFFVMGHPAGWQWMAIQLDDGSSLMLNESRGLDGAVTETIGSLMDPAGNSTGLRGDRDGIHIGVEDTWTSPHTGATYPSRWRVRIDSLDLDVDVVPVLNDQEVTDGVPEAAIYWEGKARVNGSRSGESISGRAYVELTGYVESPEIEWRQGLYR